MKCDAENLAKIYCDNTIYRGIDELYHYTDIDCMDKILHNDKVLFRMTNINDFPDKMESKSIEVYFDLAVERLYSDDVVDSRIRNLLSTIDIMGTHPFLIKDRNLGGKVMKSVPYDVYVLCFTTDGNSSFMTDNYIKNSEHNGCVIHMSRTACDDLCNKSLNYSMMKVLYGKEVIDSIYQFIKEELTCGDKSDEFLKSCVIPQTEMYIHQLKYCTKLSKFGLEKEIRLLKHIPKTENYNEDYQIVETNGKHYIYTELPHYSCWDVRLVGSYKIDEAQRYRDWLNDRHYRVI